MDYVQIATSEGNCSAVSPCSPGRFRTDRRGAGARPVGIRAFEYLFRGRLEYAAALDADPASHGGVGWNGRRGVSRSGSRGRGGRRRSDRRAGAQDGVTPLTATTSGNSPDPPTGSISRCVPPSMRSKTRTDHRQEPISAACIEKTAGALHQVQACPPWNAHFPFRTVAIGPARDHHGQCWLPRTRRYPVADALASESSERHPAVADEPLTGQFANSAGPMC